MPCGAAINDYNGYIFSLYQLFKAGLDFFKPLLQAFRESGDKLVA